MPSVVENQKFNAAELLAVEKAGELTPVVIHAPPEERATVAEVSAQTGRPVTSAQTEVAGFGDKTIRHFDARRGIFIVDLRHVL